MTSPKHLHYFLSNLSHLVGLPVRLYENGKEAYFSSVVDLGYDPLSLYEEEVLALEEHVGFYLTPEFHYYVVISGEGRKVVVGPGRSESPSKQELKELAFRLNVPIDEQERFVLAMGNLVPFPLASLVESMLSVNAIINDEELSMADVFGEEPPFKEGVSPAPPKEERSFNNSLAIEERICEIVRHGDLASLEEYVLAAPAVSSGTLAKEHLRQVKNTFIVTVTVVTRAAIRGGLGQHEALALSDAYIQKVELSNSLKETSGLFYTAVKDFTERVHRLQEDGTASLLLIAVRDYIIHHLSEPIKTADIASSLFLSRSKLSTKFKKETGMNLASYIVRVKGNEGKSLLIETDKPLSSIAYYLGFSSQSHFTRAFERFEGISPSLYRKKHRRG